MQKATLSVRLWDRLIKIRLCSSSLYACTLQVHYSLRCIVECWLHLDLPNCETTCAAPQWRLRRLQHMESETLMHLSVCCIAVLHKCICICIYGVQDFNAFEFVLQCSAAVPGAFGDVRRETMVAHQRQLVTIVGPHPPPKAQTEYVI